MTSQYTTSMMRPVRWVAVIAVWAGVAVFPCWMNGQGQAPEKDAQAGGITHTYSLSGPEMYKTWCASCHGLDGKGKGPVSGALKKVPSNLTQLSKKNGGKFPVEQVREYIDGRGKANLAHGTREMPVWGEALASIDASAVGISFRVNTLTSYLETLQEK
jgi:mono/diheme cytochrome c family protein